MADAVQRQRADGLMALGWLRIMVNNMIGFIPSNEAFQAEFAVMEAAND